MKYLILSLSLTACGASTQPLSAPIDSSPEVSANIEKAALPLPFPPSNESPSREAKALVPDAPVVIAPIEKAPTIIAEAPLDRKETAPDIKVPDAPVEIVAAPEKITKNNCQGQLGTVKAKAEIITHDSGLRDVMITIIYIKVTTSFSYSEIPGARQYFVDMTADNLASRGFEAGTRYVGEMPLKLSGYWQMGTLVSEPSLNHGAPHSVGIPNMTCDLPN